MDNEILTSALGYADRGWPVLPVKTKEKIPLIKDWPNQATTDPEKIKAWWKQWPDANIGLLLGQKSGLVVLDIDGKKGFDRMKKLHLPDTITATSGKDHGWHYFFKAPDFPVKKQVRLFDEVDLLAENCFIIVEPSIHPSGRQYKFINLNGNGPEPLPQSVIDLLDREPAREIPAAEPAAAIPNGQRNDTLTKLAGKLRRDGLAPAEILPALLERNRTACDPPLTPAEVEGIVKSIGKYPSGEQVDDPMVVCAANVPLIPVSWLWPGFIPRRALSLISSDPGLGKTWFGLDLATRVSRGTRWPDGSPVGDSAKTIFFTVEDNISDTIRPRLDTLGADLLNVFLYDARQSHHLDLSVTGGLERLEKTIEDLGNVKLVVIDPIADFSGRVNPNKAEDVRALLTPLAKLAERREIAILLIGHLNKAQTMSAIYRSGGSTSGWLGKVRAAFTFFRDIDNPKLRHIVALKVSQAEEDPPQLEFTIRKGEGYRVRVSTENVDPEEHMGLKKPGRQPREKESAVEWLDFLFEDRSEIPAKELEMLADGKGFSSATLKRAKQAANAREAWGYRYASDKKADGTWAWMKIKKELF